MHTHTWTQSPHTADVLIHHKADVTILGEAGSCLGPLREMIQSCAEDVIAPTWRLFVPLEVTA